MPPQDPSQQPISPKRPNWFARHKVLTVVVAVIVILLVIPLLLIILFSSLSSDPFKSDLDAIDITHHVQVTQLCTAHQGGNESNFHAASYVVWYDAPELDSTIENIQTAALNAGYHLVYKENDSPYIPDDMTIKKSSNGTTIPNREPDYTLSGTNKNNGHQLEVSAYRGTQNINCNVRGSIDPEYRTITPSSGKVLLSVKLSKS